MGRWLQLVTACVVIAAVLVVLIAPAYSLEPTALRAWNSSLTLLATLCTLVFFAVAGPLLGEEYFQDVRRYNRVGSDRLRLTCTLLI